MEDEPPAYARIFSMTTEAPIDQPFAMAVDDDPILRMEVADILERAGFKPHEAEHGDEAVQLLEQRFTQVVVLFTDVEIPGRATASLWPVR